MACHGTVTLPLVWAVLTSLLGCLLPAGHALGVINTPEQVMRAWITAGASARGWSLSPSAEVTLWAAVVSAFVFGAAVGAAVAPKIADTIGCKGTLFAVQLLSAVSCALFLSCYSAALVELLLLGRLAAGLAAGMATVIVSLYLSEVCPAARKGVFSAIVPLGFTVGMLIAYLAGMPQLLGAASHWQVLLSVPIVYALLGALVLPFAPESPTYCYVILQDVDRAKRELSSLRRGQGSEVVSAELSLLQAAVKHRAQEGNWTLRQLWRDAELRKLLLFVLLLNIGQQLSGINAVFYYSTMVFRSAGLDVRQSTAATLGTFIANVVMSVSALPLLRYFRRRSLLSVSLTGMLVCLLALVGSLTVVQQEQDAAQNATIPQAGDDVIVLDSSDNKTLSRRWNVRTGEVEHFSLDAVLPHDGGAHGDSAPQQATLMPDIVKAYTAGGNISDERTDGTVYGAMAMTATVVYVLVYGAGLGPIPYCYAAETFPSGPRALAVAVGGSANWAGNFAVGLFFPLLQQHLHHYSFLLFVAIVMLMMVVILWKLPEPSQVLAHSLVDDPDELNSTLPTSSETNDSAEADEVDHTNQRCLLT